MGRIRAAMNSSARAALYFHAGISNGNQNQRDGYRYWQGTVDRTHSIRCPVRRRGLPPPAGKDQSAKADLAASINAKDVNGSNWVEQAAALGAVSTEAEDDSRDTEHHRRDRDGDHKKNGH
jgi:hypothetical protein